MDVPNFGIDSLAKVQRNISQLRSKSTSILKNLLNLLDQREYTKQIEVKKPKLPSDFADLVLNCELDLEADEIDISLVNNLVQLYMKAMEFYESIGNDRYLIFQNKMKNLWTRPNVINAMSLTNQQKKSNNDIAFQNLKVEQRKKDLEFKLMHTKQAKVKDVMEIQTQNIEKTEQFIKNEINQQQASIMDRLAERRARSKTPVKKRDATPDFVEKFQKLDSPKFGKTLEKINQLPKNIHNNNNQIQEQTKLTDLQILAARKKAEKMKMEQKILIDQEFKSQLEMLKQQMQEKQNKTLVQKVIDKVQKQKEQKIKQIFDEIDQKCVKQILKIKESSLLS